jgi:hypothetical protein
VYGTAFGSVFLGSGAQQKGSVVNTLPFYINSVIGA